jgi:hypothetical protein
MTFPLGLLLHTLAEMGYHRSLLPSVERSLSQLEEKAVLKRVPYSHSARAGGAGGGGAGGWGGGAGDGSSLRRNESQSALLVSVKSRFFRETVSRESHQE